MDWIGWQDDTLVSADIILHLVGGFTEQRVMACERIVRESLSYNPNAYHITINPTDTDLEVISPGMKSLKLQRIQRCEDVVSTNCLYYKLIRIDANNVRNESKRIINIINEQKMKIVQ